jgi:hypothetical protein
MVPADHGSEAANALATAIREVYVLPPRERAARRYVWLAEHSGELREWGRAAVALSQTASDLAALDPRLTKRLIDAAWPPVPAYTHSPTVSLASPTFRHSMTSSLSSPADGRPAERPSGNPNVARLMVAVFIIAMLRGLSASDEPLTNRSYTPSPYITQSIPTYTPPVSTTAPADPLAIDPRYYSGNPHTWMFNVTQVEAYKKHERTTVEPPPAWYHRWVLCGKPEANVPVKFSDRFKP